MSTERTPRPPRLDGLLVRAVLGSQAARGVRSPVRVREPREGVLRIDEIHPRASSSRVESRTFDLPNDPFASSRTPVASMPLEVTWDPRANTQRVVRREDGHVVYERPRDARFHITAVLTDGRGLLCADETVSVPRFAMAISREGGRVSLVDDLAEPARCMAAVPIASGRVARLVHTHASSESVARWRVDAMDPWTGVRAWEHQPESARVGTPRMAASDDGGVVVLHATRDGEPWVFSLDAHTGLMQHAFRTAHAYDALYVAHNGAWVALFSRDAGVVCHCLRSGAEITGEDGHATGVADALWLEDGRTLLTLGRGEPRARVWDVVTRTCVDTIELPDGWDHAVLTADRRRLVLRVSARETAFVDVLELPSGARIARVEAHRARPRLCLDADGESVHWIERSSQSALPDRVASLTPRNGRVVRSVPLPAETRVRGACCFAAREPGCVWVPCGAALVFVDTLSGTAVPSHTLRDSTVRCVHPSADIAVLGRRDVVGGTLGATVAAWRLRADVSARWSVAGPRAWFVLLESSSVSLVNAHDGRVHARAEFSESDDAPTCAQVSSDGRALTIGTLRGVTWVTEINDARA